MDQPFVVGDWTVYPRRNEIARQDACVSIEPKMMRVLICLAERPGEVISRAALLERVWPDVVVGEQVLTRAVSELRRAFGDDPSDPSYIATIIKGGYRLVASVSEVESQEKQKAVTVQRGAFAVLGFVIALTAAVALGYRADRSGGSGNGALAARPLTSALSLEYDPALSPDGKYVAYVWDGPDKESWDIYVSKVGSDQAVRFTQETGADGSPTWSPDGDSIAYYRYGGTCELYVRPARGGEERKLADCNAKYPDVSWSPVGGEILFNERAEEDGPYRLAALDLATGRKRPLTEPPEHIVGDQHATYSPDARKIAFVRTLSEGLQDVYVLDVEGGQILRVIADGRSVYGLDWTPDGQSLIIASNRDGLSALWRVDIESGRTTRLSTNDRAGNPSVRAGRLVYERWSSTVNLWHLALSDGQIQEAESEVSSTHWDMHPALPPDGKRLAFSSNRSGSYEIWIRGLADGSERRVTQFETGFVGTPRWSPDGERLVFDARIEGQADVYQLDVESRELRQLTTHEADDLAANWSADGAWVYFASSRGGGWNVWRMPSAGGQPEQVIAGGYAVQEDAGSTSLYFTRRKEEGLWRVELGTSDTVRVTPQLPLTDWGNWVVTEAGIFTVKRSSAPRSDSLAVIDPLTGRVRSIGAFPHPVPSGDPALAATDDGTLLIAGQRERHGSDLMLLEGIE